MRRWLARVPGRDAIERRQAYILQVILLVVALAFLIAGLDVLVRALTVGQLFILNANLIAAVIVVALLAVLRRGRFRLVAVLFIALLTAGFGLALAGTGLAAGAPYLALLMVPIVVAGLLLPRLWLLATTIAVYATGQLAVNVGPAQDPALTTTMSNFLFATIFIAVSVDQFGGAVRDALQRATAHEQELEAGREALAARSAELQDAVEALRTEIWERQRLEEEREQVQERMLESQRLESIGRLAGGVAHDFNNLLTAISGYTDLASSALDPNAEVQQDLAGVRHAADQAAALTGQLLAFSRHQELRPSVVDLSQVLAQVEPLLRRLLGERVRLVVRTADGLWPVLVDPSRMESIIVNLAVNARDAMESGGTLTIETANVDLDNDYARAHAEVVPGPYAMVAVADTGTGMDEATLARIFEPFFTTKARGKGTGLGLASVYGTVRQSGGHIWVYSEIGHGTTFKIYLPRTETAAPVPAPAVTQAEPRVASELILVAEDEEYVRAMVVAALERRGYTVVAVGTGEEALEVIEQRGAEIGVLLTDVVMPGISGVELVERSRAARPDLRAIFMSGYTALTMDQRQIPADVAFIEKPFTLARLDEAISEILGE